MRDAEHLLTDIVSAIANATATVCKEIEAHQQSQNFRPRNAAQSLSEALAKIPATASNRETVGDIYETFIAYLRGAPESAPLIRIRPPKCQDTP